MRLHISSVCWQIVLLRDVLRPVPLLLVRRLHTRCLLSSPKARCADNPNQWYGLFF